MINLDKPRDGDIHTIADFSELLCLVTMDRVCSRETIADQIRDVGDARISEADLDDCFSHIEWRIQAFREFYPFTMEPGSKVFKSPEDLTDKQKLYTLLLLCANLPFLTNRSNLTDIFESISLIALKQAWPSAATIRTFGKNITEYKGPKWQRINQLASDIGGVGLCTEDTYRKGDSGDGGVDLVAWMKLDDYEHRHIPSALGQCACSRTDWVSKQTEISKDRLNKIHASHPWMQMIFIPHSFRNNHGSWAVEGELASCIIFDRLRILYSIDPVFNWRDINPPELLDDFLNTRLSLV